jgi:hypothetical protein
VYVIFQAKQWLAVLILQISSSHFLAHIHHIVFHHNCQIYQAGLQLASVFSDSATLLRLAVLPVEQVAALAGKLLPFVFSQIVLVSSCAFKVIVTDYDRTALANGIINCTASNYSRNTI